MKIVKSNIEENHEKRRDTTHLRKKFSKSFLKTYKKLMQEESTNVNKSSKNWHKISIYYTERKKYDQKI